MSLLLGVINSLIEIAKVFIYDGRENLSDEHITVLYLTILKIISARWSRSTSTRISHVGSMYF